jgi:hypothetical protein
VSDRYVIPLLRQLSLALAVVALSTSNPQKAIAGMPLPLDFYTVRDGETWGQIAASYGVPIRLLYQVGWESIQPDWGLGRGFSYRPGHYREAT